MAGIISRFSEVDTLFSAAVGLLSRGEIAQAAVILTDINNRFDTHERAWCEMGNILQYHLEDHAAAAELYRKAMQLNPSYAPAYLGYADVLFAQEKFAEANAIINQALEVQGVRKDIALYKSGLIMESQGRYDEAVETYRSALLISFSDDEIIKCEKGIARCNTK
ncbi:MAG: tetratricopeptide repeat protein [Bacteroidetes bacterium]|nr:tetratricopeptide repeat protein [Bacteroidota bacterium]